MYLYICIYIYISIYIYIYLYIFIYIGKEKTWTSAVDQSTSLAGSGSDSFICHPRQKLTDFVSHKVYQLKGF